MENLTIEADYFIARSGSSNVQARAIADSIEERLGIAVASSCSTVRDINPAKWILLDYGDCVAHIFTEESREFYGLENLWGDAGISKI